MKKPHMKKYEFDAIGTHWWCEILDDSTSFDKPLITALRQACDTFDYRYSRFRDDSLVAELSRTGKLSNPPEEFLRMLDFSKEMEWATDGAFTIGVGPALHRLGYGSKKHGGVTYTDIWSHIRYSALEITIPQGLMLDFGGQGKGWLIDTLVAIMRDHDAHEFIINGGGDLYIQSGVPIELALEDPYDPTKKVGQTMIARGALAGSSIVKRAWQTDGQRHHHIIEPTTGQPSTSHTVASFVKAETALIADSLATVLILRPELVPRLSARYNAQTILITENT